MSSSSDLLQIALRCNADMQFMDRAVPEEEELQSAEDTPLLEGKTGFRSHEFARGAAALC